MSKVEKTIRGTILLLLITLLILIPKTTYGVDSYPKMPTYDIEYDGDYPYPFENYVILYDYYDETFGYSKTNTGWSEHWRIIGWEGDAKCTIEGTITDVENLKFDKITQLYVITCAYRDDETVWFADNGSPNTDIYSFPNNPYYLYSAGQTIRDSNGKIVYDTTDYSCLNIIFTSPSDNKYIANNMVEYGLQATIPDGTVLSDYDIKYYDNNENLPIPTELQGIEHDIQYIVNDDGTKTYTWKYDVIYPDTGQKRIKVKLSCKQGDYYAYKTVNVLGTNYIECYWGFTQDKDADINGSTTFRVNWQTSILSWKTSTIEHPLDLRTQYRVKIYDTEGLISGYSYNSGTRTDGQIRKGTETYNVSFNGTGTTTIYAELQYMKRGLDFENSTAIKWETICKSKGQTLHIITATTDTNGDNIDDNTGIEISEGVEYEPGTGSSQYNEENTSNWDTNSAIKMLTDGWSFIKDSCYTMTDIAGTIFGFLPEPVVYLITMLFIITIAATIIKVIRG